MPGCGNLMCACRKGAGQLFVFRTLLSFLMGRHRFAISSKLMLKERLLLLARPLIRLSSLPSLTMWQFLLPNDVVMPMLAFLLGEIKVAGDVTALLQLGDITAKIQELVESLHRITEF